MSSSSSSGSYPLADRIGVAQRLRQAHSRLSALPEALCPASGPSSPIQRGHDTLLKDRIISAVTITGNDTTHPKWGHVSRLLRMGCTSRGYVGVAPDVRVGLGQEAEIEDAEWFLPDGEAAWSEYEKKWEERVRQNDPARFQPSKYWKELCPKAGSKAELIKEKVLAWQAKVVHDPDASPSLSLDEDQSHTRKVDKGKARDTGLPVAMTQSPLGFQVVKSSIAAGKRKDHSTSIASDIAAAEDRSHGWVGRIPSPANEIEGRRATHLRPEMAIAAQIADLSEMNFLPPSFPSQLQTSTPHINGKKRREKPPPILPHSDSLLPRLVDIPSPPFYSQGRQDDVAQEPSRPVSDTGKRARSHTPTDHRASSHHTLSYASPPPAKKARMSPSATSSGSSSPKTPPAPLPRAGNPSTPSPPTLPVEGAATREVLHIPTTPNRQALPTLTELLASSRRSKARSRHSSRKNKASATLQRENIFKRRNPPAQARGAPLETADPSPAKTSFSSFASISSPTSPDSVRHRPLSPVSPMFTQNPGAFAPPFVSSQHRGGGAGGGAGGFLNAGSYGSAPGLPLARGSSGLFHMGYNSQFDVNGRVDRVSELLDRDVDYSGWLRDIPDDEETPLPAESQGQLGVGPL
ncbi:hypothetical protein OBBRIDRAFT_838353 [Obba rivulosa]|uniref:Uncharacterized protein n=1 Tax=Obba rivulosa TaxID=1052685 RepID=A0A8E2AVK4_9APHY|nr:hypothetical protein OBBRIDRAFT_838353 [Obba rivulosa]